MMINIEQYLVKSGHFYDPETLQGGLERQEKAFQETKLSFLKSGIESAKELIELNKDSFRNIYHFPNGYGASVITGSILCPFTPEPNDLCEVAVLKKDSNNEWQISYDTPITDDILKGLSPQERDDVLQKIFALTAKENIQSPLFNLKVTSERKLCQQQP